MSSMNIIAQPESAFEAGLRIFGAGLAILGAVELYGLYGISNPTHWLSNLSISISDNSFRALSMFGIVALIVGTALFMRKGVFMILGILVIVLLWQGHGKWYTIGHGKMVKSSVSAPAMGETFVAVDPVTPSPGEFHDTGAKLDASAMAWCEADGDGDGDPNKADTSDGENTYSLALAAVNCKTGNVHAFSK